MNYGGARKGAGRKKLTEDSKKKHIKVYVTQEQQAEIEKYGFGNTLSSKTLELIYNTIERRKGPAGLKFIDLFAGVGGFRLALENNGCECVFTSEINRDCQKVYYDNFGDIPNGDIRKIKYKKIPDFDILVAGFPCQPFSLSGNRDGFLDRNSGMLFFNIVEILRIKKPKMFLLENVQYIETHDNGRTLNTILENLNLLGYCTYHTILNSHDFGVPQNRERWYCAGFDRTIDFRFPTPTNCNTVLRDIIDVDLDAPELRLKEVEIQRINHHFKSGEKNVKQIHFDNIPLSKRNKYGVYSTLTKDKNMRFYIDTEPQTNMQTLYYTWLDTVCPTLVYTREPRLWDLKRRLSLEECKRLQGFPDSFIFNTTDRKAKQMLGNAVAVPVISEIVKSMLLYYYK